jgi:hypothetical protein
MMKRQADMIIAKDLDLIMAKPVNINTVISNPLQCLTEPRLINVDSSKT